MAKFFRVGGCVRDELMGVKSKDIDFAVEAESFADMRQAILDRGCRLFMENEGFLTIRARDPKLGAVDFVLCRKDGDYSDGRRPDSVEAGSLLDDLNRRDFRMNAIAQDDDGKLIDPFDGQADIKKGIVRCVGEAKDRFEEDGLRILRAIRFAVTKGFKIETPILRLLMDDDFVSRTLRGVSVERMREEMFKAFAFDTLHTLRLLEAFPALKDSLFLDGKLRLKPTMERMK